MTPDQTQGNTDMSITAYFNPRNEGDTSTGLLGPIDGTCGDHVEQNLHTFLKDAGRDYGVQLRHSGVQQADGSWEPIKNQFHICRDDRTVISPTTVTKSYGPLSLMDIADELQPFCDAGWATPDGVYDRAGYLEVLGLRLDAGGDALPNGEKFLHYIIVQNPHGAGGKVRGKIIDFRIVCANTFAMAVSRSHDFEVTHRVSRKAEDANGIVKQRLAFQVEQWENVQEHIKRLSETIDVFSGHQLSEADALGLTDRLLGLDGKPISSASTRSQNKRDAIMAGFNNVEMGTNGVSLWDWNNAVTSFLSSPKAESTVTSKVSALDRTTRNISPDGSGAKVEALATRLSLDLIAG
jgi:hypothetical protein